MPEQIIQVLLVEDSPTDALIVREELDHSPGITFAVTQVERLSEALVQLKEGNFAVVLLDLSLPDSDGFETFTRLCDTVSNVPVVVLSGRTDEMLAVRAVQSGAQDYLVKGRMEDQVLARAIRYAIERQRSESALRDSELKLRHIVQALPAAVYTCDVHGCITLFNQAAATLWGQSPELTNDPWGGQWKIYYPDGSLIPPEASPMATAIKLCVPVRDREILIKHPDGSQRSVMAFSEPIFDTAGVVSGAVNMFVDVTERKRAQETVRLLSSAMEQSKESVLITDTQLDPPGPRIIYVNPAFTQMTGYTAAEVIGKTPRIFQGPFTDDALLQRMRTGLAAGEECIGESVNKRKDGTAFHLEWQVTPIRNAQGTITNFLALQRDITERKRAEEALRMSSRVMESMGEGVNVLDRSGVILYSNPALYEIFGYPLGSLVGQPTAVLSPLTPEENLHFLEQVLAEVDRTGSWSGENSGLKKDGSAVLLEIRVTALEFAGRQCVVAVLQDITQKKQLELHLLRSQRMEGLGRLAGGIAHDMNNILAPIMMSAPILRAGVTPERTGRIIDTIESCAKRGAHLVKQLLFFGRGVEGVRSLVDLHDSVQEIKDIVGQTFPKRITISTEVESDTWTIQADPTQIHQVLLNLCVNARDAIADAGGITILVGNVTVDKHYRGQTGEADPGPYVCLAVTDTGTGISAANIDKIFDPFFTTKETGSGTGLGLSTVLGIVKAHDGFVTLESAPGQGSTFRIHLPAAQAAVELAAEPPLLLPPRGEAQMVLIVDDEELIRVLTSELLVRHGYQVVTAANGAEALTVFAGLAGTIKLVLTDCDMPVMDGVKLARTLRSKNPSLKIIMSTGIQSALRVGNRSLELDALGGITHLAKPFSPEQLLNAVHDRLDGHDPGAEAALRAAVPAGIK